VDQSGSSHQSTRRPVDRGDEPVPQARIASLETFECSANHDVRHP